MSRNATLFPPPCGRSQRRPPCGTENDTKNIMNKPLRRTQFTLGDLIEAVSSESRNSREATLAVMDLLQSRRVVLGQRKMRRRR